MPSSAPAVLIVDDEKAYHDVLSKSLEDLLDCPIYTFSRPMAALWALPEINVGLIVSDYYMPELHGIQFLERALQQKPGTPCLIITGHSDAFSADDLEHLPEVKEVLSKPFSARFLAQTIQKYWTGANAGPTAS